MPGSRSPEIRPIVLESANARLFAFAGCPHGVRPRHGLIVCPAFAEEMNRSRRTVRLLCGAASANGVAVINPDLYGTGDSPGEFEEARWSLWLANLEDAWRWLSGQGCAGATLLGIRSGALLAWELLRNAHVPVEGLVFWQPVLSGKTAITELLRTRIAAAPAAAAAKRETVAELRQRLIDGSAVEAAGYTLSPQLVSAMETVTISPEALPIRVPRVLWIEIGGDPALPVRQGVAGIANALSSAGVVVELKRQQDPPFWGTTETTQGSGTVTATVQWLHPTV